MVNWSISDNLDKTVRDYLSQIGQENNISTFIEKIVQEKLFELQVEQIKRRNQAIESTEILAAIDAAFTHENRT
jgi:Ribbon-helix-helix domain